MPYDYNRTAFKGGCSDSIPILLRTYCALVSLELGLKDYLNLTDNPGNGGHDLPSLLLQLKLANQNTAGLINALQTQLISRLTAIKCQGKRGRPQAIPACSYPHLRYLRHENDWAADNSSDAELDDVHATIKKLTSGLKHHGVNI